MLPAFKDEIPANILVLALTASTRRIIRPNPFPVCPGTRKYIRSAARRKVGAEGMQKTEPRHISRLAQHRYMWIAVGNFAKPGEEDIGKCLFKISGEIRGHNVHDSRSVCSGCFC